MTVMAVKVMVSVVMPTTMPAMVSVAMPVVVVMFGGRGGRRRSAVGAVGRTGCHGIKGSRRRIARKAENCQEQDQKQFFHRH